MAVNLLGTSGSEGAVPAITVTCQYCNQPRTMTKEVPGTNRTYIDGYGLESRAPPRVGALAEWAGRHAGRRAADRLLSARVELGAYYGWVLEAMPGAVLAISNEGLVQCWNPAAERLFGYTKADAAGQHISFVLNGERSLPGRGHCSRQTAEHWQSLMTCSNGRVFKAAIDSASVSNSQGQVIGYVWTVREIGEQELQQEELYARLRHEALTDPLTGVANRRRLDQALDAELNRATRQKTALSLVMADLDNLKLVNDKSGHAAGDALICTFVSVAQAHLRGCDLLARIGGDEFVILMPGSGRAEAGACVERMRAAFARAEVPALPGVLSASFGILECLPGNAPPTLLRHVDEALCLAKKNGRNCVHYFDGDRR